MEKDWLAKKDWLENSESNWVSNLKLAEQGAWDWFTIICIGTLKMYTWSCITH